MMETDFRFWHFAIPMRCRPAPLFPPLPMQSDNPDKFSTRRHDQATTARVGPLAEGAPGRSVRYVCKLPGDDRLDLRDRRVLRVDVVGDNSAVSHDRDAVDHLEDMVNVVRDQDAGVTGIARIADKA